ncbi:GNAT family N-acetyltransferase [Guptibacillus algicola]|uniref:GNAT family N-acetyltransferase n=1 Tax=Guptibacillus algicola TaxID=225844 RepID=UPI001CD23590|nr:GNAT family N-acetyltransferase [Alkalihalobacillus algicola]MCA0985892.1 GNAT family N-acetyltransferase [Alkalihalobacillus algicola]
MKPILFNFPHEIYTERLYIRCPLPGDGLVVHESIQASRPELKQWMPFAKNEQSKDEVEENIREAHTSFLKREDLRLHIFHRETGVFIGSSGLHKIDWDVRKFEIGYWIDSRYSGFGYITEAVKAITQFAFKELHAKRVEIRCDSKNDKSMRVIERLDFPLEGVLRNEDVSIDGTELRDTCVYAKVSR